jgi:phosphatidate cytidylyltransferase
MKKIFQRLMMFIIGLPAVLVIVIALPQMHHLAASLVLTLVSALGAAEFAIIVGKRGYRLPTWEAAGLGSLIPLSGMISASFGFNGALVLIVFMIGVAWVISSRIFSKAADLEHIADRTVLGLSALIYPGVFIFWIVRMTSLPHATSVLLVFLLTVFSNDSLAWFFGLLFGANNRGFIAASPNKSIAGFVGGLTASIVVGLAAPYVFPAAFTVTFLSKAVSGILLGAVSGAAAIIGDLAESTIKRSADVKDSGSIIPGRGGILDSIDSLSFAAPVFYAAYLLLF